MSTILLRELVAMLPRLSRSELEQLSLRLKSMLQFNSAPTATMVDDLDFVLGCVAEVMRQSAGDFPAMAVLRNAAKSVAFQDKLPGLLAFFRAHDGNDRKVQRALICIGFELLYDDMTGMGLVVSANTLLAHAHRVPAVLNQAFPGYARSGLLHWVVRERRTA
jgi:hypothetical protein